MVNNTEFVPKSNEASAKIAVKQPSRVDKIKEFVRKHAWGVGALGAAVISSPVIATGHTEDVVRGVGSAIDNAAHSGLDNAQKANTEKVRKQLESQGREFGELRASAIDKDPKTGEDGTIYEHGSLGGVSIKGVVGVKVENQELIIHSGEPSTDGEVVSVEDLKKLDETFNPNDAWWTTVVGGPYDVNSPTDIKDKDWVRLTVKGEQFFVAEKFAHPDGKRQLEINNTGRIVSLPPVSEVK